MCANANDVVFINTTSNIQNLSVGDTQTHKRDGHHISLLREQTKKQTNSKV
jgi:hypothetical protein